MSHELLVEVGALEESDRRGTRTAGIGFRVCKGFFRY